MSYLHTTTISIYIIIPEMYKTIYIFHRKKAMVADNNFVIAQVNTEKLHDHLRITNSYLNITT